MGAKLAKRILNEYPDHHIDVVIPIPGKTHSVLILLLIIASLASRDFMGCDITLVVLCCMCCVLYVLHALYVLHSYIYSAVCAVCDAFGYSDVCAECAACAVCDALIRMCCVCCMRCMCCSCGIPAPAPSVRRHEWYGRQRHRRVLCSDVAGVCFCRLMLPLCWPSYDGVVLLVLMVLVVIIDVERSVLPSCCSPSPYTLCLLLGVPAVERWIPLDSDVRPRSVLFARVLHMFVCFWGGVLSTDTARTSALQCAYHLNIPFREGFIKNRQAVFPCMFVFLRS